MVNLNKFVYVPNRIMSIDASTTSIAYALFENERLILSDKVEFSGKNVYQKIASAIGSVVQTMQDVNPEAIVIERAVFINSPKTMSELSMVQGAILAGASLAGIKIFKGTNPIAWQSYIGNGKLTKDAKILMRKDNPDKSESWHKQHEREVRKQKTINFVNINYDLELTDNDIADAIGIGHYAIRNWERLGD
jgi:Holliday junction resolvasome RuvABC endonuclease subunit